MQIAKIHSDGYRPILLRQVKAMTPANDSREIIRGPVSDLQNKERYLLSELATGDVDINSIMTELQQIRKSILAAGGKNILKSA